VHAVTNLASNYSSEHFAFAVGQCREVIAKIIAEDNSSNQQIARVRILKYLDLQLARSLRWIGDGADLMAGVLRGLIELRFWARFISKSSEQATQFLNEASIDARELYQRLETFVPPNTYQLEPPGNAGEARARCTNGCAGVTCLANLLKVDSSEFLGDQRPRRHNL
jgi:hypothetical protein